LQVPVLRDVQNMSFADIEAAINHYGKKAASGSLALEDMAGGTFTMCVLCVCVVCVCCVCVCVCVCVCACVCVSYSPTLTRAF